MAFKRSQSETIKCMNKAQYDYFIDQEIDYDKDIVPIPIEHISIYLMSELFSLIRLLLFKAFHFHVFEFSSSMAVCILNESRFGLKGRESQFAINI